MSILDWMGLIAKGQHIAAARRRLVTGIRLAKVRWALVRAIELMAQCDRNDGAEPIVSAAIAPPRRCPAALGVGWGVSHPPD